MKQQMDKLNPLSNQPAEVKADLEQLQKQVIKKEHTVSDSKISHNSGFLQKLKKSEKDFNMILVGLKMILT